MTTSGSSSQQLAVGGASQIIWNPSNWGSSNVAAYASAVYCRSFSISSATPASSLVYLPASCLVLAVNALVTAEFNNEATISIGSLVGGSDICPSTLLTTSGPFAYGVTIPSGRVFAKSGYNSVQSIYITLSGTPTIGSAVIAVQYYNGTPTPLQN